ncbi:MAG: carboxypeptidase regulatory-like domain-containing protein, partial [Deltaproteobacteria bacterium]|nr:carboxypeptidase regulatory-like domain-containing protein [Deltaproteobacteria bacterium]
MSCLRTTHRLALAAVIALAGCQDLMPGNPYDPRTPSDQQARGEIRGAVFLDDPSASTAAIESELQSVAIRLRTLADVEEGSVSCLDAVTPDVEASCEPAQRTVRFRFKQRAAGSYRIAIEGISLRYVPVVAPPIELDPGEVYDLGTLHFVPFAIAEGTGAVEGLVELSDGQRRACDVKLLRGGGAGFETLQAALSDLDGRFSFVAIPPGEYVVSAELDGYTPDYSDQFGILGPETPAAENTEDLTGDKALQLHPISTVLMPAQTVPFLFGQFYTSADLLPLMVLPFGGMTEMRLATDPTFASGTQAWVPHALAANLALPDQQGAIAIHGQFRNSALEGFTFTSPVYSASVVRDTVVPEIAALEVIGQEVAGDGRIWLNRSGVTIGLAVDASDLSSGVYSIATHHDAANSSGDPSVLPFRPLELPVGLVRLEEQVTLSAGDGEKRVFVYLKDRAGNLSMASDSALWVDTEAPVIESLVVNGGNPVTGSALVPVALSVADNSAVVAMQVWEEGTAVPAPIAFQETATIRLRALDYAATDRQINAVVWDVAGNASLAQASPIRFDDRGALRGLLTIERDIDGSPGSVDGLSALVNGTSYPALSATAGHNPGEFAFEVGEIPAAGNLRLELRKSGYATAYADSLVSVLPGVSTDVGSIALRLARGAIEGYVQLAGEIDHSGIVVTLQGASVYTVTDAAGYFHVGGVTAGVSYTVVFRRDDNWTVETLTGVLVPADSVYAVSTALQPILLQRLAGAFAIREGSYTNHRNVTLEVSYEGAVEYQASEDPGFGDTVFDTFANRGCVTVLGGGWACPFSLSDSDALHHVYVQFSDPAPTGFVSEPRGDVIVLDRAEPQNVVLVVNDGAAYLNTLAVTLALTGTDENGLAQYQLAHRQTDLATELQESDWSTAHALTGAPIGVALPGALSYRTVRVWGRLIDMAGNTSAPALASFVLDPSAPTGGSLVIDGGRAVTRNVTVTLTLTATDQSPLRMLIGDERVPDSDAWEPFASSKVWIIPPAVQGTKKVCAAFLDAAGNRSQDYCDEIEYDSLAPPTPVMSTTAGQSTNSRALAIDFTNWSVDVATIEIAANAGFAGSSTYAAQSQVQFTLPEPDGVKTVYARYLDAAGNRSELAALTVALDRQPPQLPAVQVASGSYTTSLRPQLLLSALGAAEMWIAASADCSGGSWQEFATAGYVDLAEPDGTKDISAKFRDEAHNETACLAVQVTLDRMPPQLGAAAMVLSDPQIALDSSGTSVESIALRIDLDVSGASQMKISNQQGTPDAVWQPFATPVLGWRVTPTESNKTVYAVFRDAAGNPSAETSAELFVRTSGDITGTVTIEGGGDPADVSFVLDGSPKVPRWEDTRFTIEGVLVNFYSSLVLREAGYDDAGVTGIQIRPGGTVDVGNVALALARGNVEGYVQLAGATSHENVLVELVNSGYTARSNSAGYFFLENVLVGSYDLRAGRDGYTAQLRTAIAVATGQTTRVSTAGAPIVLPVSSGDFSINGGASYTSNTQVHLRLDSAGMTAYRASESEDFVGDSVPFEAYTGPGDYDFPLVDTQGPHTVFVQFHDGTNPGEVLQSTIILDTVAPTAGSVLLAGGAEAINVLNVSAALSSTDANGIAAIHTSEDGSNWSDGVNFQT